MKLISLPASPFARKARVMIIELDLQDTVEIVDPGVVTPVSNNDGLNDINPLGMIPSLVLDNGESLYDSPVICEYLNHVSVGSVFPSETDARFKALQLQALADGMMDVSVALRYELAMRPAELHWQAFIENQGEKISRCLVQLEKQCDEFSNEPTIGEFTVACALGYRDFRFGDMDWRAEHPKLAAWFATIMQRESLASTIPG